MVLPLAEMALLKYKRRSTAVIVLRGESQRDISASK